MTDREQNSTAGSGPETGWRETLARQRHRLQSLRDQARERFAGGAPGLQVATVICQMMDEVLCELFESVLRDSPVADLDAFRREVAVVAVGGTGRGELAPYSDLDVLFLHTPHATGSITECLPRFVRDCWDAGIKLSHSVRTPRDALTTAAADPQFATSLVESRLLWGNEALLHQLQTRFRRQVGRLNFPRFYHAVVAARETERRQFGETERQLEPDIKRSAGGLRDIQLIRWIAFARCGTSDFDLLRMEGALTREDQQALIAAHEFMTSIRVDLHFSAEKAQDVLTRDEQLRLAALHGVPPVAGQRPVERFMQLFFRHATNVADIANRFLARYRPVSPVARLWKFAGSHRSNGCFSVSPHEIEIHRGCQQLVAESLESQLHVFELAAQYSVKLSPGLVELIRRAAPHLPREVSPLAAQRFLSILRSTGQVGYQLREMYRTGVLEILIPEVNHARCLLQFNQYHAYTVDEHSFRAVEAAERFEADAGAIGTAYRHIKNRELLHLALLLHDLGKGYEEDHSDVGARIASDVGARLGLPERHIQKLIFLVHKHLLMANLAFRRDLSDAQVLARFSREVGSTELLRMLLVLTAADMTAVGPGTWTNWKADLLVALFEGALPILSGAPPRFRQAERLREVSAAVREVQGRQSPPGPPVDDELLAEFPLHYLTATQPEQIVRDLAAIQSLGAGDIQTQGTYNPATGTVEYRVITRDTVGSGLFHKITGVLAAKGLQILSANICTTPTGIVIDSFHVQDVDHAGEVPWFRLREIEDGIREVVLGKTTVEQMFDRHRRFVGERQAQLEREPTRVVIDNESSESGTVIDVFADDRRGLLYAIAAFLFDAGLSVSLAIISTHIDQVLDVFYVTDREGRKLPEGKPLLALQTELQARIERFEQEGLRSPESR